MLCRMRLRTRNGREASFHKARLGLAPGCQLCIHLHLIHHSPTTNLQPLHICYRHKQISISCDFLTHRMHQVCSAEDDQQLSFRTKRVDMTSGQITYSTGGPCLQGLVFRIWDVDQPYGNSPNSMANKTGRSCFVCCSASSQCSVAGKQIAGKPCVVQIHSLSQQGIATGSG